jgi:hypothetical protein
VPYAQMHCLFDLCRYVVILVVDVSGLEMFVRQSIGRSRQ